MNLKYEFSHLAKLDLEYIWKYTANNWSVDQANKYYKLIIDKINEICKNPNIGKSLESFKKKHRVIKVISHLVIYKLHNDSIFIDRILHKRMDIETRINE